MEMKREISVVVHSAADDAPSLGGDTSIVAGASCVVCSEPIDPQQPYIGFPEGFYHSPVCVSERNV